MNIIFNKGIVFSNKELYDLVNGLPDDVKKLVLDVIKKVGFYINGKIDAHKNLCYSWGLYNSLTEGVYSSGIISRNVEFSEFIKSSDLLNLKLKQDSKIAWDGGIKILNSSDHIVETDINAWETRKYKEYVKKIIDQYKAEKKKAIIDTNKPKLKETLKSHILSRSEGFIKICLSHFDQSTSEITIDGKKYSYDKVLDKAFLDGNLFKRLFVVIKDEDIDSLLDIIKNNG